MTRYGVVQVQVVITDGAITDVTALEYPQTDRKDIQINNRALPLLKAQVLAAQSAKIDGVSGATFTTDGYVTSLQSALDAAGFAIVAPRSPEPDAMAAHRPHGDDHGTAVLRASAGPPGARPHDPWCDVRRPRGGHSRGRRRRRSRLGRVCGWADRVFSTYRPDSDISRIRRREIAVRDADPAVAQVLDFAEIARRLTGGAFDVNAVGEPALIRPESSRAGPPLARPRRWPRSAWTTTSTPAATCCCARPTSITPGGSASSTPTIRAACSPSSSWPPAPSRHPAAPTAASTSGIRPPDDPPPASPRPPLSARHWSGRTFWQRPLSPAGSKGWISSSGRPDIDVMLTTDDGAVLLSEGFASCLRRRCAGAAVQPLG